MEAYEAENHSIDVSDICGLEALRHLMNLHGMTASDLARLLRVHVSLGSKILKGDRAWTVAHMKILSKHFKVRPTCLCSAGIAYPVPAKAGSLLATLVG